MIAVAHYGELTSGVSDEVTKIYRLGKLLSMLNQGYTFQKDQESETRRSQVK